MTISERNSYHPAFTRYSPAVTAGLQRIAQASALIESARILPAQEEILRHDAKVGSVHYSNLIEGNELPEIEAKRAVEYELDSETKAKLELVNYVAALDWMDERHRSGTIEYTPEFLKGLHAVLTRGLGRPDDRFKPHHEGEWRDGEVRIADGLRTYFVAPPQEEVERLMTDRLEWLEDRRTHPEYFGPIIASLAHFEATEVHPFADYNGRTARLLAVAVLLREGTISRYLFSPERYYAKDRDAYLAALRAIQRDHTLNAWLEYYVNGIAHECERVAGKVAELNRVTDRVEAVVQLSTHQERIVAELTAGDAREITRADAQALTSLARTRVVAELNSLVGAGVLRRRGSGPSTSYVLGSVARERRPRGPTSRWTEARIRGELTAIVAEIGRWPSTDEFRAAGRMGLYVAASRAGGIKRWRAEITGEA